MYVLSIFPFLQGANELYIVFILDILLLSLLLYKTNKDKTFKFTKDLKFIAILIWSFSYLITTIYSPDTELAFLGFLKFFTVPIFLMLIMQYDYKEEQRDKWFYCVAQIGAIMMLIILFMMAIGQGDSFFYQNRLAGFFNYANSFALFLLIGVIILGFKEKLKWYDFVMMLLLIIGILISNSRAIMLISGFAYLLILIFNRKARKQNLIGLGMIIIIGIITTFIMQNFGINNRISVASTNASEWLLRLLYYKDALRLIAKNIFGYGHMAWWYMQESFQTGSYDSMYVHNGLLQIAVDAGIIPALMIAYAFIAGFFDEKTTTRDRVLMIIILGHSLIDFNMEFLSITLILFMTLNFKNSMAIKYNKATNIVIGSCIIIYLFFCRIMVLEKLSRYEKVNEIFSYSTALNNEIQLAEENSRKVELSKKLYEKNKYFSANLYILSSYEQEQGNYDKAYEYELQAVQNVKYTMLSYIKYVSFLEKAIKYYGTTGNEERLKYYINKLFEVEDMINDVRDQSDPLAFKIAHKPRLDIPKDIINYVSQMRIYYDKRFNIKE